MGRPLYFAAVVTFFFFFILRLRLRLLLLLSSFFPRLFAAVGNWMSTVLPHMMWP